MSKRMSAERLAEIRRVSAECSARWPLSEGRTGCTDCPEDADRCGDANSEHRVIPELLDALEAAQREMEAERRLVVAADVLAKTIGGVCDDAPTVDTCMDEYHNCSAYDRKRCERGSEYARVRAGGDGS